MANMTLGTLTFEVNPNPMPVLKPRRPRAKADAFEELCTQDWPETWIGKEVRLPFTYMPATQFDDIDEIDAAGEPVVWNPQFTSGNLSGYTFNVRVWDLDGEYCLGRLDSGTGAVRKDVTLILVILSAIPPS